MATVNKDFKIKHGLVVEGQTGTINGNTILTESGGDAYILDLIGGETLITSVDSTDFKVTNGELKIDSAVSDLARTGDITNAIDALTTADIEEGVTNQYFTDQRALDATALAYDTVGAAAQALADAEDYTDGRELAITTAYEAYADQAELDAIAAAESYTDGRETAITTAYEAYADQAELDAKAYTDTRETAITSAYQSYADQAEVDAKAYTDTEIASLVDGAPALLDTLNELAAAIADNPNYATDVANLVAGKQDTLTAGSNIDITDDVISVTGLDTDDVAEGTNLYFTNQRALDATAAAYEVADAVSDHNALTTGVHGVTGDVVGTSDTQTLSSKTISGDLNFGIFGDKISSSMSGFEVTGGSNMSVQSTTGRIVLSGDQGVHIGSYDQSGVNLVATQGYVDALDSDDIEEGSTNQYFTDSRATDAAGALLAGASKSNITISYDNTTQLLTVEAENGVADSDTDDLTEGTSNLYFTNQRVIDAINGTPITPTSVTIDGITKQVAGQLSEISVAQTVTPLSWPVLQGRSAKLLVKTSTASHSEVSEVLLTLDSSNNVAITEYANISTNGALMSIAPRISSISGNTYLNIDVTTTENNSTVTVFGTLLV